MPPSNMRSIVFGALLTLPCLTHLLQAAENRSGVSDATPQANKQATADAAPAAAMDDPNSVADLLTSRQPRGAVP